MVVLDLTVPGHMGGKECLARARSIRTSMPSFPAEHQAYGFRGVVAKPYQVHELSETLRAWPSRNSPENVCLYRNATQTVFGEGVSGAALFFVGEQPGDSEDRLGHPFVGPAGRLLNETLATAGLAREGVYVTNAVKHFKWQPRGKRRMHKNPEEREIRACAPWLIEEIALVRPRVVMCLGVTAARAVFGKPVRLKDLRGIFSKSALFPVTFVTIHPAAILRLIDADDRRRKRGGFVADLEMLRAWLSAHAGMQAK
jgi:DNA polymerase